MGGIKSVIISAQLLIDLLLDLLIALVLDLLNGLYFQMAQELGLVERDPNYVNPYREDTKLVRFASPRSNLKNADVAI